MRKMKYSFKTVVAASLLSVSLMAGCGAQAVLAEETESVSSESASEATSEIFTTDDGVISIETPSQNWVRTNDPNYWFTISNGKDTIILEHLSNGESLPQIQVADNSYGGVFQAFMSTKNEVFVVKALAADEKSLQDLIKIAGTVKVLKYDTKTALQAETASVSEFGLRAINAVYYVSTAELNVRSGCTTDSAILGVLKFGDEVTVKGAVTRNGADYGWYQISYNGGDAYVSAGFLNAQKPAGSSSSASSSEKAPSGDGFTVYDSAGTNQGKLVPYTDGYYYSNDAQPYVANGDNSFYGVNTGDTLYAYDPTTGSQNTTAGGFTVYDANGINQGLLTPGSDGYYYSNDEQPYTANGDNSFYGVNTGDTLYAYDPTAGSTGDGFTAYDESGLNQGLLVPGSDGYYYSNDEQPYTDNGDDSYYGVNTGDTLYNYDPTVNIEA